MHPTPPSLDSDTLPYELLLRKSAFGAGGACEEPSIDAASTVEPAGSSSASSARSGPHNVTSTIAATLDSPEGEASSASATLLGASGKGDVTLLRNVAVHGPHADEALAGLILQVRELSEKAFDEDCLAEITKKSCWKLSLLASKDHHVLCGFIVAKVTRGSLSIAKLAVREELRGRGFGRLIMDEMTKSAKKQGDIFEVCLSSLPTAIKFYQRLGFKAFWGLRTDAGDSNERFVEGQVYMEKRLRPRRR